METETVSNRLSSLMSLYDMQTTFFSNAIDGISDEDAHNRLQTKANHIAWLTGSLVQQRYDIANALGIERKQAANELFKDHKGIQDNVTYPSLVEFKKDWDIISPELRAAMVNVNDERLDEIFDMMPDMTISYFDLITFSSYREANCIGQIALWRRLLGYEPMRYM